MKRINLFYFILLVLLLAALTGFSNWRSKQRKLEKVEVIFRQDAPRFLSTEIVNKLLIQSQDSLFFKQKDMLALRVIEQELLAHPTIKKAQIYTVPQGNLYVEIEERTPLFRVIGPRAFYVDETGSEIPLSPQYSPEVPLFYGAITKENMKALVELVSSFSRDTFLTNEVIDVRIENNQFVLGLRSFPFSVVWGRNQAFEQKVEKLKRVCAYVSSTPEKEFSQINLIYKQQVVARYN
ncbi:MAG: cell division protein FtsQ/DivIB [Flavobacteriaceae bacterium]